MPNPGLFISYAREDESYVARLTDRLEEAGVFVSYDRKNMGIGEFSKQLEALIKDAAAVLVVVSADSVRSEFVLQEIHFARSVGRPVIPLIRADVSIPLVLAGLQWVDARTDEYPLSKILSALGQAPQPPAEAPRIYAQSDSTAFVADLETLMSRARRIVLIGMGLNVLHREALAARVMKRAADKQCALAIYLADPDSPAVQTRLVEEELNAKPSVGVRGLRQRLEGFLRMRDGLCRPEALQVRLFAHYPTFALIAVDDDYFIYPYGFARLGNYSPVFRYSKCDPQARDVVAFLEYHAEMVHRHSFDAQDALDARRGRPHDEKIRPFALFFIPDADSGFYTFGTRVLGYDVRGRRTVPTRWESQVGTASDFGFHLTVTDVLYFPGDGEVAAAAAEAEFLFRELGPFELENIRVEIGSPNPTDVCLRVDDPTRKLEALHSELVARVYRRAANSNYTAPGLLNSASTWNGRADSFVHRYQAPYVLQKYRPHFTLLTAAPTTKQEIFRKRLEAELDAEGCPRSIRVGKLCVMDQPGSKGRWVVRKEILPS